MTSAKIILDSVNKSGDRLTTYELEYPRIIHSEFMTYATARNAASTRARPISKVVEDLKNEMFVPPFWGKNQKGMQSYESLDSEKSLQATEIWKEMGQMLMQYSQKLSDLGVHKQWAGRPLETISYITIICTASEHIFKNMFFQRTHHAAQPEFQTLANMMQNEYNNSTPQLINDFEWHLPYLNDKQQIISDLKQSGLSDLEIYNCLPKISAGRCARVSYLNHNGVRNIQDDLNLFEKLIVGKKTGEPMHLSPLEHQATPIPLMNVRGYGKFAGWIQYRKQYEAP